jgi:hypothetical protein
MSLPPRERSQGFDISRGPRALLHDLLTHQIIPLFR